MARAPETGFYFEPISERLVLVVEGFPFPSDDFWAYVGDPVEMTQELARLTVATRWPGVDPEALQHRAHIRRFELLVLLGERIDAGVDEVLRDRQALREFRQREDGAVILRDKLAQEGPGPSLWPRGVDVTPPDPAAPSPTSGSGMGDQGCRLWIVDEDDVGIQVETRRILPVGLQVGLQHGAEMAARCASINTTLCPNGNPTAITNYAMQQAFGLSLPASTFTYSTPPCGNKVSASFAFVFPDILNLSPRTLTAQACFPA